MHPPFEYLGYTGSVAFCAIDRHYSGFIEDTSDQITYEAANLEGLRANFEAAVDEYVRLCIDLSAGAGGEPGGEGQMSIHVSACAADLPGAPTRKLS